MRLYYNICIVAALICVLVAGGQAANITVNVSVYKHNFTSNETIPSIVTNMTAGIHFSQKTTFYQYMKPGEPSEIGNNNVTWPFAHKDDIFNMTNVNTTNNSVYIGHWWPPERGGGYEQLWFNGTSSNITTKDGTFIPWTWNRTYHYEYDQIGTYISRWHADPVPGARIVESTFWINGTKLYGPRNFSENTSVWSRNPSFVTVDFYENDTHAAHDWFTIDMDLATEPTLVPDSGGESYPGETVGTVGTIDPGTESSPTVTPTTASSTATATGTGTAAPSGIATPGSGTNTSAGPETTDQFPWLSLLALLLLLGLVLVGFVMYRRRKNGNNK
jgi:hypothetical protein